jgi:hypothetical protein
MKFRVPELFLGVLLAVAIFAIGMVFSSQHFRQSTQAAAPEKAEAQAKAEQKGFWVGVATDPVAAFTLGLVLVGLAQAGLFYVQLRLIRISLDDAKIAADAAADAANAAARQAHVAEETLAKIERPYLFIFNISALSIDDIESAEEEYTLLRATYSIANYGKIPAIIKNAMISFSVFTEPLAPARLEIGHSLISSPILAPGETRHGIEETFRWDGDISYDEWGGRFPALGNDELWFWAIIAYRGPFTDQHEMRVCLRYDSATNRFTRFGGPEHSGEK